MDNNRVYSRQSDDENDTYWYSNDLIFKIVTKEFIGGFTTIWYKPFNVYKNLIVHRCASDGNNMDLPAIEHANGTKEWWVDGKRQRCGPHGVDNDLPAIELANGTKEWWFNGKQHRDNDLPAVECMNGDKIWWFNGKRHRDNGLPAVELANGDSEARFARQEWWYVNGKLHRDNGPAIEFANGDKEWFVYGDRHRDNDLPAVERANGTREWWNNGVNSERHRCEPHDVDVPAIESPGKHVLD